MSFFMKWALVIALCINLILAIITLDYSAASGWACALILEAIRLRSLRE